MAIVMYLIGCFSLMIYNAVVIYRKKSSSKAMSNDTNKWIKTMNQQFTKENKIRASDPKYEKHMIKSLKRVEKLIAFSNALNYFKLEYGTDLYNQYIRTLVQSKVFNTLAVIYRRKKNEERAYFAYFISQHPHLAKDTKGICADIISTMVSYIEDSDIYCRSNVLKVLCSVGDVYGVVNTLQLFNDKDVFIHHKLLAEDLFNFTGDKEVLSLYLWGKYKMWNDNLILGVITFITMFSNAFKDTFLPVLKNKSIGAEVRLAIIRYYKKYRFAPAQPILIEYLNQTENYDFATEAADTLSQYPGQDTINALTTALQSDNWYVQHGAASSLVVLDEHLDYHIDCIASKSNGAFQIVQYMLEHLGNKKDMNMSELII